MLCELEKYNLYTDLQYKYSVFIYDDMSVQMENMDWGFINYTFGIERKINNIILYYSLGNTHRHPTRNDMFSGLDYLDPLYYNKMKSESVIDNEWGIRYFNNNFNLNTNIYYMKFGNEITLNGQIGPTGLLLHDNVDNSFRSGLEIDFRWKLGKFNLVNNSSFSYNKIKEGDIEFEHVLTPNVLINQDIFYTIKKYTFRLSARYQGESYLDFANEHKLPEYFNLDASVKAIFDNIELSLFVNNLTNRNYYTNGIMDMDGKTPLYFVQASINWFVNLKIKF